MTHALSHILPPSLGSFFGQRADVEDIPRKPLPPGDLPGAFAAPELCLVVDPYRAELLPRDPVVEVKLDGIRCLHIAGRLWTREGSPFEAAEHCLPILQAIEREYGVPMFFDGEYVEEAGIEATLSSFRKRTGTGMLWLFDALPLDRWQSGMPAGPPLWQRKEMLMRNLARAADDQPCSVGFIKAMEVSGACKIEQAANDLWAAGYEGLIVKSAGGHYHRRRTSDWMKVKLRTSSHMVVVDVLGGTQTVEVVEHGRRVTKRIEVAKSLLARLPKDGAPAIRLKVDGGLAETLWRNRNALIGGKVLVEHAGFTGGGQPREAVLKQVTL